MGSSFDVGAVHASAGSREIESFPKRVFFVLGFQKDIVPRLRQRSLFSALAHSFLVVFLPGWHGPFFPACAFVGFEIPSTLVFLALVHRRPRLDLHHLKEERRAEAVRGFLCRRLPRLECRRRRQDH